MGVYSDQMIGVIKEAIRLEVNGRAFFEHAAELTKNEKGKKMFNKLAQDEVKHLQVFSEIFTELTGGNEWKQHVDKEDREQTSPLIEELRAAMEEEEKEGHAGELAAVRIGMQLERNAIDFFEKSAEETDDSEAVSIFKRIAEEERFHYDLLQAQFDSVNNSGFWLDISEFQMDGKY